MMMITASEALTIIVNAIQPTGMVTQSLERSNGKVLGESIVATENIPSFDNAGMDGYALHSTDTKHAPVVLKIVGEIPAGAVPDKPVRAGEAMSIMTGAQIPDGADAVAQVEWAQRIDETGVRILRPVNAGHNVRRIGSDIQKGATILRMGERLRPQEIGVLASIGRRYLQVYRPVQIAVLTTGDEIIEMDTLLVPGKIRNSNAFALRALVEEIGAEAKSLGIAADEKVAIRKRITEGLESDMLVTSGGVSVGKFDLVLDALKDLGAEVKFWKVNIRPGMPLMFAMCKGKPVFGLPGNPVSAVVTFVKFVKPAVLRMMGYQKVDAGITLYAVLGHDIEKHDGKKHFIRGIVENRGNEMIVRTTGPQASNVLTSVSRANCLITIPEGLEMVRAGEKVEVELI